MQSTERKFVARRYGKWSQPGVPHRGWVCIDVEDLGSVSETCEMCESQSIRYVHTMYHPHFSEKLNVGCVCAGNMEGDIKAANARERVVRNSSLRRRNWPKLKGWKVSMQGNDHIKKEGFHIVIFQRSNGMYAGRVLNLTTDEKRWTQGFRTEIEAKLATFDLKSSW